MYNETFPIPFSMRAFGEVSDLLSFLLTKEKYLFCYKPDLYFKDLKFNDIFQSLNLYS